MGITAAVRITSTGCATDKAVELFLTAYDLPQVGVMGVLKTEGLAEIDDVLGQLGQRGRLRFPGWRQR